MEIELNKPILASALAPTHSTENFRWLNQSNPHVTRAVETGWLSENLPSGFKAISTHEEKMADGDDYVVHVLYSDGLAKVSVFIATLEDNDPQGASTVGGSNAYSTAVDDRHVTVVGKVPLMTVKQIATTMRAR